MARRGALKRLSLILLFTAVSMLGAPGAEGTTIELTSGSWTIFSTYLFSAAGDDFTIQALIQGDGSYQGLEGFYPALFEPALVSGWTYSWWVSTVWNGVTTELDPGSTTEPHLLLVYLDIDVDHSAATWLTPYHATAPFTMTMVWPDLDLTLHATGLRHYFWHTWGEGGPFLTGSPHYSIVPTPNSAWLLLASLPALAGMAWRSRRARAIGTH